MTSSPPLDTTSMSYFRVKPPLDGTVEVKINWDNKSYEHHAWTDDAWRAIEEKRKKEFKERRVADA